MLDHCITVEVTIMPGRPWYRISERELFYRSRAGRPVFGVKMRKLAKQIANASDAAFQEMLLGLDR